MELSSHQATCNETYIALSSKFQRHKSSENKKKKMWWEWKKMRESEMKGYNYIETV